MNQQVKFSFQFDFSILRYKRKWRLDGDGHGDATAELYRRTALAWNIYTPDRGEGQENPVVNGLFICFSYRWSFSIEFEFEATASM